MIFSHMTLSSFSIKRSKTTMSIPHSFLWISSLLRSLSMTINSWDIFHAPLNSRHIFISRIPIPIRRWISLRPFYTRQILIWFLNLIIIISILTHNNENYFFIIIIFFICGQNFIFNLRVVFFFSFFISYKVRFINLYIINKK